MVNSKQLTVADLRELVNRAHAVIKESEHADEHAALLGELDAVATLCRDEIGASHMGSGADVVILGGSEESPATLLLDALRALGIAARWEYPGVVVIAGTDGHERWIGTANENWTADLMSADGSACLGSVDLGIASTSTDIAAIAQAIQKAVTRG